MECKLGTVVTLHFFIFDGLSGQVRQGIRVRFVSSLPLWISWWVFLIQAEKYFRNDNGNQKRRNDIYKLNLELSS
jgi:hypothetical protein